MKEKSSFTTRVCEAIIDNAAEYEKAFAEYDYLLYSKDFKNRRYYIISAEKDNYKHLTGVQTELSGKEFFEKCLTCSLTEDDFSFSKKNQSEKEVKGSVRRKITVLPLMKDIFNGTTKVEEDFEKNRIRCSFAAGSIDFTLGFVVTDDKARPKTLLKGDEINKEKSCSIDCILRKHRSSKHFNELLFGDILDIQDELEQKGLIDRNDF